MSARRHSVLRRFLLLAVFGEAGRLHAQETRVEVLLPATPSAHSLVAPSGQAPQPAAAPDTSQLTRAQAEALALHNNPRVSASRLLAMAQGQVVRETRSAELPQLNGSITAEAADTGSRIASGGLNDSRLFQHAGGGVQLSQLITDFGRTGNLLRASRLEERAQQANALATREDIALVTDKAFYSALEAQALVEVARQSVRTRQATEDQVHALANNNLRSTLDLSITDVDLSQAQLLELDASSNANAAMAALDEVLGLDHEVAYTLVDDAVAPAAPPPDAQPLIALALGQRPDLASADLHRQSAEKFTAAQSEQRRPTVTALGTVGGDPVRPGEYFVSSWDGAIGANINVPLFNGFLFSSETEEARLRTAAASEQTRQLRNSIVRAVETAWLDANNAYRRIAVTEQLLRQANKSLALASTRYRLGLASIADLSQAQLAQTEAAITHTNAEYGYKLASAMLQYQTGAQP